MENNMKAMREALEMFCGYSATVLNTGMFNRVHLEALLNKAKAALAKPARNCDIGTADEQAKRFEQFCGSVQGLCDKCDLDKPGVCPTCGVLWAQWTYKAPATEQEGESNEQK